MGRSSFQCLKLLRFFAPFVPKISFSDNAMPELEMIEMRLREVHLKVNSGSADDETTKLLVNDLKDNTEIPKRPPVAVVPNLVPISIVINQIFYFEWLEIVEIFITKEFVTDEAELGKRLLIKWDEFYLQRQFWIGLEVGSLAGEVTSMASRRWPVAASLFSWVSSYRTQRPTAMVVGVFMTLEVRMTLHVAIMVSRGVMVDECDYTCVQASPPNLLLTGENDSLFYNDAYQGIISLNDINDLMSKIYQGLVKASDLKQCPPNSD
uniref:Uncharacterized protein n=1 Tax=Leersia perrieri TaxID=77586 RepID=A0A0D9XVF9_9ORYZ